MTKTFKLELTHRPRRLRRHASRRALVVETVLHVEDLIAPLFVVDGKGRPEPIASMPGVHRFSIRDLVKECRELHRLGIPAVALFPKLDAAKAGADFVAAARLLQASAEGNISVICPGG